MRNAIRVVTVVILAVASAIAIGVTSTITAAVLLAANPVALVMGGTGRPNPDLTPPYMQNVETYYINRFSSCTPAASCDEVAVVTPEEFFPFPMYGGLSALTFDQSVAEGLDDIDAALQAELAKQGADRPESVTILGYSQSGRITSLLLRRITDPDYTGIVPDADELEIVLIGNWSRPNGGLASRFAGLSIPFLGVTFDGPTPTDTGYQMTDISFQWDPISDFPLYITNPFAVLNSILAFEYIHGTYPDDNPYSFTADEWQAQLDDPANRDEFNENTDYITIAPKRLPLLEPLRGLGAATGLTVITEPLALLLEPTLTVFVELGYDRSISPGTPTRARLIPIFNPITLAEDLVKAAVKGVEDAVGQITGGNQAPAVTQTPADTVTMAKSTEPEATPPAPDVEPAAATAEEPATRSTKQPKVTLTTPANRLTDDVTDAIDAADDPAADDATPANKPQRQLKSVREDREQVSTDTTERQRPTAKRDNKSGTRAGSETSDSETKDAA